MKNFTTQELAAWRARIAEPKFVTAGDAGTNTPGDWTRILGYANTFLANPSIASNDSNQNASLWTGYPTLVIDGDYYPRWHGHKMQCAAFAFKVLQTVNPALSAQFGSAAKAALLTQFGIKNANISLTWSSARRRLTSTSNSSRLSES